MSRTKEFDRISEQLIKQGFEFSDYRKEDNMLLMKYNGYEVIIYCGTMKGYIVKVFNKGECNLIDDEYINYMQIINELKSDIDKENKT